MLLCWINHIKEDPRSASELCASGWLYGSILHLHTTCSRNTRQQTVEVSAPANGIITCKNITTALMLDIFHVLSSARPVQRGEGADASKAAARGAACEKRPEPRAVPGCC
mmetsp:Transcript_34856/g.93141  ORF Transcript_34856/g.93141 Transcript_34856/m.93141 type:complete len:110 (-) Transcript_34856:76-405(-)